MTTSELSAGGAMRGRIQAFDWPATSLGPLDQWSQSQHTALHSCLASPVPMALWLGPEFVLCFNDAWQQLLGSSQAQSLGCPGQVGFAERWATVAPALHDALATGRAGLLHAVPLTVSRAGVDEECFFTWFVSPIHDAAGQVLGVSTVLAELPTTAPRQPTSTAKQPAAPSLSPAPNHAARAQVEQAFTQLEAMLNHLPLGLAFFDRELRYVRVNAELARMHGLSVEAHLGQTLEAILPLAAPALRPRIEQVFATGEGIYDLEVSGSLPTKPDETSYALASWYPVTVGDEIVLVGAVVQDITPRKRAEATLRQSQHFLQRLTETVPNLLYVFELQGQRNIYANRQLTDLLGYTPEEAYALDERFLPTVIHPDDWAATPDHLLRLAALRDGEVLEREYRMQHRTGAWRWFVGREMVFARADTGQPTEVLGSVLDITARKVAEERLRRLHAVTARLAEAQSLAEVRRLILEEFRGALEADGVGLRRIGDDALVWEELAPGLGVPEAVIRRFAHVPLDAAHPAADVARSGAPVFASSARELAERYPQLADALAGSGVGAHAHLPLRRDDAVVGVISLNFATPRAWDEDEQAFALALADRAASAYERAQLLVELRHSEARYRSLVEASAQVVWSATPDGRLLERRERWSRMTGIPLAELPDEPLDLVHPEDRAPGGLAWQQALERVAPLGFVQRVRGVDGHYRTWQVRAAPVLEADGRVREWVGTDSDITAYRQAEQALLESEARLNTLLAQLPLGVGLCDREGHWLIHNPPLRRYTSKRLPSSDPTEQRRWRSWTPDGALLDPSEWAGSRALRGELVHPGIDFLHTLEDGSEIWVRVSAAPFRNGAGEIVGAICMVQDIDERKRAEAREARLHEAVVASEQQLRLITDGMPALISYVDSQRRYQFVNKTYTEWFGLQPHEVIGQPMWAILGEAAYAAAKPPIDRALEGHGVTFERLLPYQHGGARYVQATYIPDRAPDDTVKGFFVLVVDLTERKQAEDQLRYQTRLLEALTESTLDGILIVSPEGRMLRFNQQFLAVWQFPPEVIATQSDEQALAWAAAQTADPPAFLARVTEIYDQPDHQVREELTMRDGRVYERFGAPILDGDTRLGWFWTFRDISERKAAERERERLLRHEQELRLQAEEANRLKDEFLATVSHELRTPLTALLGYAQMLQSRKRDEAYIARTVEKMVRSAKAQAQLIEDLLDISRIVSGRLRLDPAPVALSAVVRAALDTVRPATESKQLTLLAEFDPAAARVVGDAHRLQQVIWNLLANAVKFTPPGGAISVQVEQDGQHALISVTDTGQGISPEFLPYVFDRFRQADGTTNRSSGGLGLGLAIVRHLVELHGGSVAASSPGLGLGATFSVRLPLAADGSAANRTDATSSSFEDDDCPPELAGLRVLIVDDQPPILELLEEILAGCGAEVRACASAREALATVQSWQPQVLVSDIAMPNEDGYWLIEQVRALPPEQGGSVPALALTAYVRMEDRLQVLAAGFEQYVPKPVEPTELRAVVAHLARVSR